jgi:hypothetical protein
MNVYNELIDLAEKEYNSLVENMPEDDMYRSLIFIEAIRQLDCISFGYNTDNNNLQFIDTIKNGWHLAAFHLFKPVTFAGFLLASNDKEIQEYAEYILYQFGCIQLLKRTAEMIKSGMVSVSKDDDKQYYFKMQDIAKYQFVDEMYFRHFYKIKNEIGKNKDGYFSGWDLVKYDDVEKIFTKEGNYFSVNNSKFRNDLLLSDIDSIMLPLLKPWVNKETIISYGTTKDIDNHFLVQAAELTKKWQDEAGFHPNIIINGITAAYLMSVTILIVALHLKHIKYIELASKNYPQISTYESITIWEKCDELINSIEMFTGYNKKIISTSLDLITLKEKDVSNLGCLTSRFMPLLIDIGDGYVLRPVSGVLENPFITIFSLLENRNQNFKHDLSKPREEWLRTNLYAAFAGNRYQTIFGNINLRNNGIIVTDIDAAVFDNLTGELALFQIKWQDFFYMDVKKLRSKASNLTKDIDDWADKVTNWIDIKGKKELSKSLRLKGKGGINITEIFLFGLSKNAAQMLGYGFEFKSKDIAMCNWPQFQKNRTEIGPADKVISNLFKVLKQQATENKIKTKPMPVTFEFAEVSLHFQDLWNVIEE